MNTQHSKTDVILIGGGIMSATLGTLLKELSPDKEIKIFEKLEQSGEESSNVWNNAGTGHSALCELNYTKEGQDGSVDITKAIHINEQFQLSKQFWAYLIREGHIESPDKFIQSVPHMSFVKGEENVKFLKSRVASLQKNVLFEKMKISQDPEKINSWVPLMMEGRQSDEAIAITYDETGTDVNFGELTRKMAKNIEQHPNANVQYNHEVIDFNHRKDGKWEVKVRQRNSGDVQTELADYVFIGAGGGAIPLLQKTGIPESKHLGGFPITGQFLICTNPDIIAQHDAKVYGKEPPGTPPMTVPHLDTRYIDGERTLLFGPFASVGPKFLKNGSNLDLFKSVKPYNITTLLSAAAKNLPLIKYSFDQILMTKEGCMNHLRTFYPEARDEDWQLYTAGKRVQVIKDTPEYGKGFIQFGTEVVNSEDHSVIALLGESPGASTSVSVALEVLEKNFPEYESEWTPKIQKMIPSYGKSLINDTALMKKIRQQTSKDLELNYYQNNK